MINRIFNLYIWLSLQSKTENSPLKNADRSLLFYNFLSVLFTDLAQIVQGLTYNKNFQKTNDPSLKSTE
ncbi:MAG: hypothetical protein DRH57_02095 [Candidatus Cloacimonadota bacterium]|nr:MAG: hypothetical protein DRH57_02095 [Candidatus Cloacimonadota bacterium]